jgi:glutathione S-transferase
VEDYTRWFYGRLRGVDAALAQSGMLCGGRFTVADISVGYALMLADHIGLSQKFSDRVATYWQKLRERQGFRRALAAQDLAAKQQGIDVPA